MSSLPESLPLPPDVLFRRAFDDAAIGMALLSLEGNWLRVNRAVCEFTGYSEEELLHLKFQDITHPDDLELDLQHVDGLVRGETLSYEMEKRYLRRDGKIVWALLSVSLAVDDEKRPLFFISQIQNITARKNAETLSAAAAELEHLRSGLVKVCAWTKRVEINGQWVPIEKFLSDSLHLRLTHGMSDEAVKLFAKENPSGR